MKVYFADAYMSPSFDEFMDSIEAHPIEHACSLLYKYKLYVWPLWTKTLPYSASYASHMTEDLL